MLDDAGFPEVPIVLSSNLDELVIWQILTQVAQEASSYGVDPNALRERLTYGVGTRLITSEGDPSLGGVYKLVSVQDEGKWQPAIKVSDSPAKTPNPGNKSLWRVYDARGNATADLVALADETPQGDERLALYHPSDATKRRALRPENVSRVEPLLVDVLKEGKLVYDLPDIEGMREQRERDVAHLNSGVKRLVNPHIYHVSLTKKLYDLKQDLIASVSDNGH